MTTALSLQHMGPLHPHEHLLVYLLAFGPFLLLALTIWISRRRNAAEDAETEETDVDPTELAAAEHSRPRD